MNRGETTKNPNEELIMRLRDSIALTLPSFFLRLVLGVTFIWAGTGKLVGKMQVSGDDAARLANLGVVLTPIQPANEPPAQPGPDETAPATDTGPDAPLPDATPPKDAPAQPAGEAGGEIQDKANEIIDQLKDAVTPKKDDGAADTPTQSDPPAGAQGKDNTKVGASDHLAYSFTRVQQTSGDRTGSDFPEPVECQRLYGIALMISKSADPGLTADSQPITPIMPPKLAAKPWPKVLAWCAAITELVAGSLLILGLFTRLSALGVFIVMLVAMWMTQIGPAALHSSDAILGFIPNHHDLFSPADYMTLLWQLALASMSLSVVFLGSGAIGLDRLIFSSSPRDPYLHGDPKAQAAKPQKKQPMNPATAQRTEFDRSPSKE